nr:tyrosine-type recombinase/integrase [Jiella sonneratiae]
MRGIAATGKIQKFNDGGGLYLHVTPKGSASWRIEYAVAGERRSKSFGKFPEVSLVEARASRDRLKSDIAGGIDPDPMVSAQEPAASAPSALLFGELVTEYLAILRKTEPAVRTIAKNEWLLLKLAAPLHGLPVASLRASDILPILQQVAASGRRESAVRLRGVIGTVFNHAIRNDLAERNPADALKGVLPKVEVEGRAAITDEPEFAVLLRAIDSYDEPTLRHALQFSALVYGRPVETRTMRKGEIDFANSLWNVPRTTMKMRRDHVVPLPRQAIEVLKRQFEIAPGDIVFPQRRKQDRPISENALNVALDRLGYGSGIHTAHGFRSSASTILNERGWRYDVIEASLAHVDPNAVRRAYNRAAYLKERAEMAQAWADLCDEFRKAGKRRREMESLI